jgi:hypothetical protein
MAADKPTKSNPFNPEALLEAQRRNFAAFTNAGQIVADGMRTYAERQVSMVQEAMSNLWSEMQATATKPATPTAPAEQLERMRAAFEKVLSQVQELSSLLLKVQSEAMSVLNECAAKNMEAVGSAAPEFADLQRKAREAFESAMQQTTAVIAEMKRRMSSLEQEAHAAAQPAKAAPEPQQPAKPARVASAPEPAPTKPRRGTAGKSTPT